MLLIGKWILVYAKEKRMRSKRWPQRPFFYMRALALLYITSPSYSSHCFLMKDGSP